MEPVCGAEVKPVAARGGFGIDIRWQAGMLAKAVIRSRLGHACVVRYGDKVATLNLPKGTSCTLDGDLQAMRGTVV